MLRRLVGGSTRRPSAAATADRDVVGTVCCMSRIHRQLERHQRRLKVRCVTDSRCSSPSRHTTTLSTSSPPRASTRCSSWAPPTAPPRSGAVTSWTARPSARALSTPWSSDGNRGRREDARGVHRLLLRRRHAPVVPSSRRRGSEEWRFASWARTMAVLCQVLSMQAPMPWQAALDPCSDRVDARRQKLFIYAGDVANADEWVAWGGVHHLCGCDCGTSAHAGLGITCDCYGATFEVSVLRMNIILNIRHLPKEITTYLYGKLSVTH